MTQAILRLSLIGMLLSVLASVPMAVSAGKALASSDVLDISELLSLGVKESTVEDIITVSLMPRARPPLQAGFIKRLAEYGGDELTASYLRLDSMSAGDPEAPISQETIKKLMSQKVKGPEIVELVDEAALDYRTTREAKARGALAAEGGTVAPSAGESGAGAAPYVVGGVAATGAAVGVAGASGGSGAASGAAGASAPAAAAPSYEAPADAWTPDASDFSSEDILDEGPKARSLDGTKPDAPKPSDYYGSSPSDPSPPEESAMAGEYRIPLSLGAAGAMLTGEPGADARPKAAPNSAREYLRHTPQSLRRGQKADPSRPMPRDGRLYPVREPQGDDEYFMGTYRYETLDGHQVDVHRAMKSGSQGTRVESRGDGAKVHRYFSGSPERKRQGMANPAKA
ncbi:MAG: hypothetical protein LBF40_06630, partial [Deltaproteobacteria bacterium]|nr:hypothetical protein [Deltaproteobacteria bacterium]